MKQLILDYFRRKALILVPVAIIEFAIGCFGGENAHSFTISQLQIGLFAGAFLLSLDMQRGLARTVAALPLTRREIARGWWHATVSLPALALSGMLLAGFAVGQLVHPNLTVTWQVPAMSALFLTLWLGTSFTLLFGFSNAPHFVGWRKMLNGVFGALWGGMIGGSFWFLHDVDKHPVKLATFLIVTTTLSLIGWFRAERFVTNRASFRLGISNAKTIRRYQPVAVPQGFGGIWYFISTVVTRAYLLGMAMILFVPVVMLLQGARHLHQILESFVQLTLFPFWFVMFFISVPAFLQLRYLRSLPVSANQMALALMTIIVLPLAALGMTTAGITALTLGTSSAHAALESSLLTLPSAACSIVFVAWLGSNTWAFVLMFLAMLGAQTLPVVMQMCFPSSGAPPLSVAAAIAAAFLLGGFLLTRHALTRSSSAYRVQAQQIGGFGWGSSR